jgi:hypothetical protein
MKDRSTTEPEREAVWGMRPQVRWISVGPDVVVYQSETEIFVGLDGTAAELWLLLVSTTFDLDAAVAHVLKSSSTSGEEAQTIIETFVVDLESHGLVQRQ